MILEKLPKKINIEEYELRPFKISDAEKLFSLASDEFIGRCCGWSAHKSLDESKYIIENILNTPGTYAITLNSDLIGAISLFYPTFDIELMLELDISLINEKDAHALNTELTDIPPIKQGNTSLEIGFWLGREYFGKGIIKTVSTKLIEIAFDLGITKIYAGYFKGNFASQKLQEKLGFQYVSSIYNVDIPLLNMTILERVISEITSKID